MFKSVVFLPKAAHSLFVVFHLIVYANTLATLTETQLVSFAVVPGSCNTIRLNHRMTQYLKNVLSLFTVFLSLFGLTHT